MAPSWFSQGSLWDYSRPPGLSCFENQEFGSHFGSAFFFCAHSFLWRLPMEQFGAPQLPEVVLAPRAAAGSKARARAVAKPSGVVPASSSSALSSSRPRLPSPSRSRFPIAWRCLACVETPQDGWRGPGRTSQIFQHTNNRMQRLLLSTATYLLPRRQGPTQLASPPLGGC